MKNIEHVVLLMLENRSFDSVLGWLYEPPEEPWNTLNRRPGEPMFDGLSGVDLNDFVNEAGDVSSPPIRGASGLNVPQINPGEMFANVNVQLFEKDPVAPGDSPTMKGYLRDYRNILDAAHLDAQSVPGYDPITFAKMIMESYTPSQLPVINGLAEHYAVCDRWFASVPSQTNANRAFSLCGTSLGLVDNGYLEEDPRRIEVEKFIGARIGDDRFRTPTLWNALHGGGYCTPDDWMIFWQGAIIPNKVHRHLAWLKTKVGRDGEEYLAEISSGRLGSCYTYRLFPHVAALPDVEKHFAKVDEFHHRARGGTLPKLSFVEPRWTLEETAIAEDPQAAALAQVGNDYHPPGNTLVAEEFLRQVYLSLISNEEAWRKTLLVVTADEGVGQFDHVKPPPATSPWGDAVASAKGDPGVVTEHGFRFDRHGSRVPTILVSPYVPRRTVFRAPGAQPYDHTSLIATVLEWLGLHGQLAEFGERTKGAPTFEEVLSLHEPRSDAREVRFLISDHKLGDPVRYFDRLMLRGRSGKLISAAEHREKSLPVDSTAGAAGRAYFPTLGRGVLLHLEKAAARASTDAVSCGDVVKIIAADASTGASDVLGAWPDSPDCYYDDDYLGGGGDQAEQWTIRSADGSSPIRFGDEVVLESAGKPLAEDAEGKFLRFEPGTTASWTILPPPRSQTGTPRN